MQIDQLKTFRYPVTFTHVSFPFKHTLSSPSVRNHYQLMIFLAIVFSFFSDGKNPQPFKKAPQLQHNPPQFLMWICSSACLRKKPKLFTRVLALVRASWTSIYTRLSHKELMLNVEAFEPPQKNRTFGGVISCLAGDTRSRLEYYLPAPSNKQTYQYNPCTIYLPTFGWGSSEM